MSVFAFLVNGFLSIRHLLCLCHVPVSPVRIRQSLRLFMIFPSHVCVYSFSFSCLFSFVHVCLCHFLSCLYLPLALCLTLSFISVMSVYRVCYYLPTSSCIYCISLHLHEFLCYFDSPNLFQRCFCAVSILLITVCVFIVLVPLCPFLECQFTSFHVSCPCHRFPIQCSQ